MKATRFSFSSVNPKASDTLSILDTLSNEIILALPYKALAYAINKSLQKKKRGDLG
jgi:hypothetical protein